MKYSFTSLPIKKVRLKKYPKPLYYRGTFNQKLLHKSLAIVGSRNITQYGQKVVEEIIPDLVSAKVTTISGFMYGVDTEVHRQTIENGGITIAVLGCGLDCLYPAENEKLYSDIVESGGCILSEYDKDAKPHLWKFPQRNKIVVSLSSLGVLVVEAGLNSGSLVTAELALKAKKNLYAIPGPITSTVSSGTNQLIKNKKAKLVSEASDIEGIQSITANKNRQLYDALEQQIIDLLSREPLTVDEIHLKLNIDLVALSTKISLMTLKGVIGVKAGKYYY